MDMALYKSIIIIIIIIIMCQGHPTTVFSRILLKAVLGYVEYF